MKFISFTVRGFIHASKGFTIQVINLEKQKQPDQTTTYQAGCFQGDGNVSGFLPVMPTHRIDGSVFTFSKTVDISRDQRRSVEISEKNDTIQPTQRGHNIHSK
ncbi:hypothetical protein ElyMa_002748300 [Elysia marginata]|uniref:Uncharacterized protein n=1 Tax=Elysia marginata TaxID=1093978 RepID=A0AAV4HLR0_9GAST|nr:hypothetical protein ElyMa_002748300 [Elysia marginata]